MTSAAVMNVLLTGRPGIGKTTVIQGVADALGNRAFAGFYTEEIRAAGRRRGFRVVSFSGVEAVLAHVNHKGPPRVARYGVDVQAFERVALAELERDAELFLIDEIGKMECFSTRFVECIPRLLDSKRNVVATVAEKGGGLMDAVKRRPDVECWTVTMENRATVPDRLIERLSSV